MMIRLVAFALVVTACKGSDGSRTAAAPPPVAAPAKPAAPSKVGKPTAKPAAPTLSPAQRKAYGEHLRAGRKLARATRWADAAREFEAALVAVPMDGRALSELGWAAFQAGDHDRARSADTDSARTASDPAVKAASLYNLGRVEEASAHLEPAARAYKASLALRPNPTVAARLAGLAKLAPATASEGDVPCAEPLATREALCACLAKEVAESYGATAADVTCEAAQEPAADLALLAVAPDGSNTEYYLALAEHGKWRAVGHVAYFYAGGVAGVENELDVRDGVIAVHGGMRTVSFELQESGTDNDLGIGEGEDFTRTSEVVCVVGKGTTPGCPLTVPTAYDYHRDRLDFVPEADLADVKDLRTPGLPIHRSFALGFTLGDDGVAKVVLAHGEAKQVPEGVLGPHKLW